MNKSDVWQANKMNKKRILNVKIGRTLCAGVGAVLLLILISGSGAKSYAQGVGGAAQSWANRTSAGVNGGNTNLAGQTKAITTAVPFLMICPDSRSGALGEAGVAIADNGNALYWNPSTLAFTQKKFGFNVNYTPWLRGLGIPDINHAFLPFYYNLGDKGGVIGAALTFFSLGNIQFTDAAGNNIGEFNPAEFAFATSYTRKITDAFSAGISLRYIYSGIAGSQSIGGVSTNAGQSFAGDIHMFYTKDFKFRRTTDMNIKWGVNISNIGAKMNYTASNQRDFIPTNLRIGYALTAYLDEYNSITLTNDFNKLLVPSEGGRSDKNLLSGIFGSFSDAPGGFGEELSEINVSLGLEYWYNKLFSVRAGYFYEDPNKGNRRFITMGAGIRFKVFTVDFAFLAPIVSNHPLQNTLRFTLGFDFGAKE